MVEAEPVLWREPFAFLRSLPPVAPPHRPDGPILIYGGGPMGRMAAALADAVGVEVSAVVDRRAHELAAPQWVGGRRWCTPAALTPSQRSHTLCLCVGTSPFQPLRDTLIAEGFRDVRPFYDIAEAYADRYPLRNGWTTGPITEGRWAAIEDLCTRFGDPRSAYDHLATLAWHYARQEWPEGPYLVRLAERYGTITRWAAPIDAEHLVDVGAHDGAASKAFAEAIGSALRRITAIEPDAANTSVLKAVLMATGAQWSTVDAAITSQIGRRTFASGYGYTSRLWTRGDERETTTIDALGLDPTLLKIHIEGDELGALVGAAGCIQTHRPILAVTSYHGADGLLEIPNFLLALPKYRVFARRHAWLGTGLLHYAIPEERLRVMQ